VSVEGAPASTTLRSSDAPGARCCSRLGDKRAAVLGGAVVALSFAGLALAADAWVIYLMQAAGVLGGIGGSAAQSWISASASGDEQGTVRGALTSGGAIAEAAVPTVAGTAFAWSLTYAYPGMVFLGAAAFATAATILMAATNG
jgi:MFS transporter, DHA1 family, tetracycline resistance protein